MSGTLYVVATPIGNLDDLAPRARQTLGTVDRIAAEDTRHTGRLLTHIGVKTPQTALHEFNESAAAKGLVDALLAGESIALVSDAGTPLLSDPGFRLVRAAHDAGVKVISYDRLIRETDAVDYYVTFDSVAVGEAQAQYLVDNAEGSDNPLYLYAGAASDNNAFLFFEGAWNVLQPKIADGTFVIENSSEAVEIGRAGCRERV